MAHGRSLLLPLLLCLGCGAAIDDDSDASDDPIAVSALQRDFHEVAGEFGVPRRVLLSVSYNVSRFEHHGGAPSIGGGYGPMHLVEAEGDDPALHSLGAAARLLGADPQALKQDVRQNLRGGAALLSAYAKESLGTARGTEADYYGAVARFAQSPSAAVALSFADQVYGTLAAGAHHVTTDGQEVQISMGPVRPRRATAEGLGLIFAAAMAAECPEDLGCEFIPAGYAETPPPRGGYGNYDIASRPGDGGAIRYLVIHDTEITYAATLRVFQDPNTHAAAHYVVRSADGHIAQMVATKDIGWHAGNWYVNSHSVGIEHEGVAIEGASWYGEQLYRASARLTRYLADRFNVPIDRAHIIGHDDVPGPTPGTQPGMHWDPGPFWDWGHYMELVGAGPREPSPRDSVIEIRPAFAQNQPPMTYCYAGAMPGCRDVPLQPASFVPLRQGPAEDAPLLRNRYLGSDPSRANYWGNKAVAGQRFHLIERRGDFDAIDYGGQLGWFYNPGAGAHRRSSAPAAGLLVTPRAGHAIPVFGRAYPEPEAYPPPDPMGAGPNPQPIVPIYSLRPGQVYVALDRVRADYYFAPTFAPDDSSHLRVQGQAVYYEIFFNHRFSFVREEDVEVVSSP